MIFFFQPLAVDLGLNTDEIVGTLSATDGTGLENYGMESMVLLQRYLNDSLAEGELREQECRESEEGKSLESPERAMEIATILDYSPDWSYTTVCLALSWNLGPTNGLYAAAVA